MSPFERIELAFLRNDTNNGKSYCIECDGNERKGKVKHKPDCVLVEANAALVQVERETIAHVVAWLRVSAKQLAARDSVRECGCHVDHDQARAVLMAARKIETGAWKEDGDG